MPILNEKSIFPEGLGKWTEDEVTWVVLCAGTNSRPSEPNPCRKQGFAGELRQSDLYAALLIARPVFDFRHIFCEFLPSSFLPI